MIRYALALVVAAPQARARDSLLSEGILLAAMAPAAALVRFEAMLARDSLDPVANWRAAVALNDLALQLTGPDDRRRRDSLYTVAERVARRAMRVAPASAPARFALGLVLGNEALTRGIRERVRMAVEIRTLALGALAADSNHDGAHHLLGRWHYEIRRLSGIQRLLAKTLLGGKVFGEASWAEARRQLERAVAIDSLRIYHRLDLARIALATRDTAAAVRELRRVATLPDRVLADRRYREEAARLLWSVAPDG